MSAEIHECTAAELAAAFAARRLAPSEVATALLDRIERLDGAVNAFCLLDREVTLAQARDADRRWRDGAPLSALDGVPVAIKDVFVTRGWPTRRGSRTGSAAGPWNEDAPSVARLREAGAVFLGKTTTPEFGWKGVTDSPLSGITRNPWDLATTAGGSSGGASAALAARFTPLATGSDGGGSIRIPAHFTGVFGLKPSFGRVPAYPLSMFGTVAHVGPMARTVTDAALFLDVIARPDARDWYALPPPAERYAEDLARSLRGRRVAYSPRLGWVRHVDPEVEALVAAAAAVFEKLGAEVVHVDPPPGDPTAIFRTLWWTGARAVTAHLSPEEREMLDPGLQAIVAEAEGIGLDQYLRANLDRAAYGSAMRQFMADYDVLLTPAVAVPAFAAGTLSPLPDDGDAWLGWTPFSYPFNLTQQPAASVNCGFTAAGLPVGLQIVGRMFDDLGVLAAAHAFEQAMPLYAKTPPGF